MSEAETKPDILRDIGTHVTRVLAETEPHGAPEVLAATAKGLGLETEGKLAAQIEKPIISRIVAEMKAFGPTTEIKIDANHSLIIGSTPALDPHTYLQLPSKLVVDEFRKEHMSNMTQEEVASLGLSDNGLPEHIKPIEGKTTYLPLHFVNWCILEDRTGETPEYKPVDALSFYANAKEKLESLGCTNTDSGATEQAMRDALKRMTEISLRNRNVVTKLYNEHLLPAIVQAIVALDAGKPEGEHKIVNITGDDREQRIKDLLTCNSQNQRIYCNMGHTPKDIQEEYDTGRGPATLEPWHNFTRYVPIDRFTMLVGASEHGQLNEEEYKDFIELMKAVGSVIPGMQHEEFIHKRTLTELGKNKLSQYIKMLDPYSDYLARYSVPVMSTVLKKCFDGHGDEVRVEQNEHMASATSLVANHGKSIRITVIPKESQYSTNGMNDVDYGVAMMDRVYGPLQEFMRVYNATYQRIFDLAVEKNLIEADIKQILLTNLQDYSDILSTDDIDNLSKALAQLKPTAKMEDARNQKSTGEVIEEDGKTRNEHILRNDLVVGILQTLIDDPRLVEELSHAITTPGFDGGFLQSFFDTKEMTIPTLFKGKENPNYNKRDTGVWNMACADILKNCFSQDTTDTTFMQRIATRLTTAVEGLERRGQRTGVRSENIPRIPGLLMSYRVRMNSNKEREFELELGIASGQRAAFEIATGGMLERAADQ